MESNRECLQIYIQGHGGNPFNFEYHNSLVKKANHNGCDFLSSSMIGLGLNEGESSFPSNLLGTGTIQLNQQQATKHGNYAYFYDLNNPQKDQLSLFLSGHYFQIKSLADQYNTISLMGISGGGWYTIWLAALLPEVSHSISYAGSLPLAYHIELPHGDWEQTYSKTYQSIDYWHLYNLGVTNHEGRVDRRLDIVYNKHDSCCFFDPEASHFQGLSESILSQNVTVTVDNLNEHVMNVDLVNSLLSERKKK